MVPFGNVALGSAGAEDGTVAGRVGVGTTDSLAVATAVDGTATTGVTTAGEDAVGCGLCVGLPEKVLGGNGLPLNGAVLFKNRVKVGLALAVEFEVAFAEIGLMTDTGVMIEEAAEVVLATVGLKVELEITPEATLVADATPV